MEVSKKNGGKSQILEQFPKTKQNNATNSEILNPMHYKENV